MTEYLTTLTTWLGQNPQWLAGAIALAAFVESLALVGVVVPGVAILYAAASLAGGSEVGLGTCLLAAVAGAAGGDGLSFLLGRHAHEPLLRRWPFRQHPGWLDRGERFIRRYGIPSVVIGRFVGPIRPVLPFVAGMLNMPPHRFFSANLLSALLWAPVYILPGYLLGRLAGSELSDPRNGGMLNLALLAVVVLGLGLMYGVHHWLRPSGPGEAQLRNRLGLDLLKSPRSGEQPIASGLLLVVSLTGLVLLILTLRHSSLLTPLDHAFYLVFQSLRNDALSPWVLGFTLAFSGWCLIGMTLLAAAFFWWRGDRPAALCLLLGQLATLAVALGARWLLDIQPPEPIAVILDDLAFPGVQAAGSTFLIVLLATFYAQQRPYHQRWISYGLAALPVLALGLARLYLGLNWISGVLGGILLGLCLVALARLGYSPLDRPKRRWRSSTGWLAAGLALSWLVICLSLELPPALASLQQG
ncbi:VTT domain-containing protein [Motiliproteus sp. SC1-56]|uniref:VTT domain-containing protein n=1 Tax=Motiliproteus sp. SC1-56 TaxID=2799565 RepID=UPI001A8E93B7|nr:VTT domain-containing protein [Motiliproteus sp. SC1-56]